MSDIKSFKNKAFRVKIEELSQAEVIEDAVFADIVYTAISEFGIDENEFRNTFGLTKGTVERWSQRQNLPQPFIRPKIVKWVMEKLDA